MREVELEAPTLHRSRSHKNCAIMNAYCWKELCFQGSCYTDRQLNSDIHTSVPILHSVVYKPRSGTAGSPMVHVSSFNTKHWQPLIFPKAKERVWVPWLPFHSLVLQTSVVGAGQHPGTLSRFWEAIGVGPSSTAWGHSHTPVYEAPTFLSSRQSFSHRYEIILFTFLHPAVSYICYRRHLPNQWSLHFLGVLLEGQTLVINFNVAQFILYSSYILWPI